MLNMKFFKTGDAYLHTTYSSYEAVHVKDVPTEFLTTKHKYSQEVNHIISEIDDMMPPNKIVKVEMDDTENVSMGGIESEQPESNYLNVRRRNVMEKINLTLNETKEILELLLKIRNPMLWKKLKLKNQN